MEFWTPWFFVLFPPAQKETEAAHALQPPPAHWSLGQSTSKVLRRHGYKQAQLWRRVIPHGAQTFQPHLGNRFYLASTVGFWWPCLDIFLQGMWSGQGCPAPRMTIKPALHPLPVHGAWKGSALSNIHKTNVLGLLRAGLPIRHFSELRLTPCTSISISAGECPGRSPPSAAKGSGTVIFPIAVITYPDKSNLKLVRNVNSSPLRLESESLGGSTGTQQPLKLSNAWPTYSLKMLVPTWPRRALNVV